MIQIVFDEKQAPQPNTDSERDLADHDLQFLLAYYSQFRNETYQLMERPDETVRDARAPDYLIREINSGRSILVERTVLMDEEFQAAKARLLKQGALAITTGIVDINPDEIGKNLKNTVARKISRGQMLAILADERILIIRNRLTASMQTFLSADVSFEPTEKHSVDHAFLIASSRLGQLW